MVPKDGKNAARHRWRAGAWQSQEWPNAEALITDPPYSQKTHGGARSQAGPFGALSASVDYASITAEDAEELAARFAPLVSQWAVIFCDHIAWNWHACAWRGAGWYVFAPVAWVKPNAAPRFQGDGPASSVEYLMIARPKHTPKKRASRPGHYLAPIPHAPRGRTRGPGHKDPIQLRRLVDGYTDPGDLVLDPYGGTATMGAAALGAGRFYEGSEVDHDLWLAGGERLRCVPPVLPGLDLAPTVQRDLFGETPPQ